MGVPAESNVIGKPRHARGGSAGTLTILDELVELTGWLEAEQPDPDR